MDTVAAAGVEEEKTIVGETVNNPVNSAVFRALQDTTRHTHAQRWVAEGMLMSSVLSLHASHRTKSFAKEL